MPSSLVELYSAVQQYQAGYRHPALKSFEISPAYDHFPRAGEPAVEGARAWPEAWFHTDRAGVYVLVDDNLELVYIGKASYGSSLAGRMGTYYGYGPDRCCRLKHRWNRQPRFAITIAVPETSRFEAAALEEFLLSCLTTSDNTIGTRRAPESPAPGA